MGGCAFWPQVLYSLRNGSMVTTFRTARLSEETRVELAALRAVAAATAAAAAAAGGDGAGRDMGGDVRKGSETGAGRGTCRLQNTDCNLEQLHPVLIIRLCLVHHLKTSSNYCKGTSGWIPWCQKRLCCV